MADEPEQVGPPASQDKEGAAQSKALDQLTDRVEEKEMDASKINSAMEALAASQQAGKAAQRQREKELAAVKVDKADIQLLAQEFELDTKVAERRLREHKGSIKQALLSFLA